MPLVKRTLKRPIKFVKKYSVQISFGVVLAVFLTVSVGEGQAYEVIAVEPDEDTTLLVAGFIGKPQVVGETVLTGETQMVIPYRVEQGDTLLGIANRYSISVGTLVDYNGLETSEIEKIKPGDEILIPDKDTNTSLAWLDDLNQLKEEERKKREQEELRRLSQRNRLATTRRSNVAPSFGNIKILGVYRNLPTRGAYAGQCTNWVKYKRADLPQKMGNGGQYISYAKSYGIATGRTPRVGGVAVFRLTRYGHVSYIEEVYSDGSFLVSEMNLVSPFVVNTRVVAANDSTYVGTVY